MTDVVFPGAMHPERRSSMDMKKKQVQGRKIPGVIAGPIVKKCNKRIYS
jgi:hypothetical protein